MIFFRKNHSLASDDVHRFLINLVGVIHVIKKVMRLQSFQKFWSFFNHLVMV